MELTIGNEVSAEDIRIANEGIEVDFTNIIAEHSDQFPKIAKFKLQKCGSRISRPVLPMSEPYHEKLMYVRKCYPEYYKYITDILTKSFSPVIQYISVTGTPGTGKSMFYNWFFDKYRAENPNKVIVCVSFQWQHRLGRCYVFEPNKAFLKYDEIPEIKNAMYLYDNSPLKLPKYGQMVAFVCPNDDWFNMIYAHESHRKIYMPVWEFDELIDADQCIGIGIGPKELTARFNFFGGVPRFCLRSKPFSEDSKRYLLTGLRRLVWNYDANSDASDLFHEIFHQVPSFSIMELNDSEVSIPSQHSLAVSSKAVIYNLSRFVWNAGNDRRVKFIKFMQFGARVSYLMGFFFEAYCYDFFSGSHRGERQEAKLCIDVDEVLVLSSHSAQTVSWNSSGYTACPSMACEAVDAYEYSRKGKCLNLFFATMEKDHVINVNRIVEHIHLMEDILGIFNLAEDILMKKFKLQFVFLIPEGSGEFIRQTVTAYTGLSDDAKAMEREQLAYAKFVNDNPDPFIPELLNICKAKVETFKRQSAQSAKWDLVLKEIPQYYFPVPNTEIYVPRNAYIDLVNC